MKIKLNYKCEITKLSTNVWLIDMKPSKKPSLSFSD